MWDYATTRGVFEHPFCDYLDGKSYIIIKVLKEPLTTQQRAELLQSLRNDIGHGFNWIGVVRFFFRIVLGADASYRVRFSIDILLVIALLSLLGFLVSKFWGCFFVVAALIYCVVILLNIPIRRKWRRNLEAQGIKTGDIE